jgi:ParB family transcriptional regulator, chromosome partitioning protein
MTSHAPPERPPARAHRPGLLAGITTTTNPEEPAVMTGQTYVPIDRVHPHPGNIRSDLGDLAEVVASIRVHGLLQPIVVEAHPARSGAYQVIAGHRRLAAAKLAGRDKVPVVIRRPLPGVAPEEMMLVENCQRQDLSAMDKAEAMGKLRARGYTLARIARRIGMAESTVSFYLSLLELDNSSQQMVRTGTLSAADAVAGVRRARRRARARNGKGPAGAVWEPDHFTSQHPLARKAAAMCDAREHSMRRRYGKIACGECWETVIRQDERLADHTLRSVS